MSRPFEIIAWLLVAPALGLAGFAILRTALPQPSANDRIAVAILLRLENTVGDASVISVNGEQIGAACKRLSRSRRAIVLTNGMRIYINGTHVVARESSDRLLAADQPAFISAVADLAGSHFLYVKELAGSIVRGREVVLGSIQREGRRVYRVRLGRPQPAVELLVDAKTLAPVAAVYRSKSLNASAVLTAPRPLPRKGLAAATGWGC